MSILRLQWQNILHLKRQFHENLNVGKNRLLVAAALANDHHLLIQCYYLFQLQIKTILE